MSFTIIASEFFVSQVKKLPKQTRTAIHDKVTLIKENPFRHKKLHSKHFSRVFRVRINSNNQETRLIYVVLKPNILLACLLDRSNEYKDLEKYLKAIKKKL